MHIDLIIQQKLKILRNQIHYLVQLKQKQQLPFRLMMIQKVSTVVKIDNKIVKRALIRVKKAQP